MEHPCQSNELVIWVGDWLTEWVIMVFFASNCWETTKYSKLKLGKQMHFDARIFLSRVEAAPRWRVTLFVSKSLCLLQLLSCKRRFQFVETSMSQWSRIIQVCFGRWKTCMWPKSGFTGRTNLLIISTGRAAFIRGSYGRNCRRCSRNSSTATTNLNRVSFSQVISVSE